MLAAPGNRLFLSDEVLTSPCLLLALTAAKADETLQGVQGSSSSLKVQGQGSSFKVQVSRLKVEGDQKKSTCEEEEEVEQMNPL